jgi:pimeloyl-ACP methyl ester carboxylesterase
MSDAIQSITAEVAGGIAIYAMLSANAYREQPGRIRFDVRKLGWVRVDLDGEPTKGPTKEHEFSGLAYDIYEQEGTNKVVFAFRGSEDAKDYLWANFSVPPFNFQYRQARKAVGKYLSQNSQKNVIATGHSLGGGLALSVSVHHGVKAFTFDSSPRIFDGIGDMHEPAERVVIYQEGEILEEFRKYWKKLPEVVEQKNIYKCNYPDVFVEKGKPISDMVNKHRSDLLAKGLLLHGATKNPALAALL